MVGKVWEGKWEYEKITYFVGYPLLTVELVTKHIKDSIATTKENQIPIEITSNKHFQGTPISEFN